MKKVVLYILLAVLVQAMWAGISYSAQMAYKGKAFQLTEPPQNYKTYDERVKVEGSLEDPEQVNSVTVNGKKIAIGTDGSFAAGLILNPGKNTAELEISMESGAFEKVSVKVLKAVSYLDSDELYRGKPHWASDIILNMGSLNIIEAYPNNRFMPNNGATKGEFATWLAKAKGLPFETIDKDVCIDVPKEHWRAKHIKAVIKAGYMTVGADNYFGIADPLNRVDAAGIISRVNGAASLPAANKQDFSDVSPKDSRYSVVQAAADKGYIKGISAVRRLFDPDRDITRAEAAALISRIPSVRRSLSEIDDWGAGFDSSTYCSVVSLPQIESLTVSPKDTQPDGKSDIMISAQIGDYEGNKDIAIVKADLTQISGPPDAMMFNDGTNGDAVAGDLLYTLSLPVNTDVVPGEKQIVVTVTDRNGWEAKASEILTVSPRTAPAAGER